MSLQQTVLIELRDLLLKGEFLPGQRLGEVQLADKLGASRTPIRAALATLAQEGLIEVSGSGGYLARQFSLKEVVDAIAVRGHLEGMAARLVAENGMSQQLNHQLQQCLADGDGALATGLATYDDHAAYVAMNDRFHALVLGACGNKALQRALATNDKLPFAAPSTLLPMQCLADEGLRWMHFAHQQHHMLVQAIKRGEGARAQALATEHTEVARENMYMAVASREQATSLVPGMRLLTEPGEAFNSVRAEVSKPFDTSGRTVQTSSG